MLLPSLRRRKIIYNCKVGDEQTLPSEVCRVFNGNGRTITTATINPRKYLRPSEILKSNKMVDDIIPALNTQFIHTFHADLEHDKLYKLDSGYPARENVCESLLQIEATGKAHMESFEAQMTESAHARKSFLTLLKEWPGVPKAQGENRATRASARRSEARTILPLRYLAEGVLL